MTPEQILAEWERRHLRLPPDQRTRFLTKGGHVERLARLPDGAVKLAIANHRRLEEIERMARGGADRTPPSTARRVANDPHPSEYGRLTMRQPARPEQAVSLAYCGVCEARITPEGRCGCS